MTAHKTGWHVLLYRPLCVGTESKEVVNSSINSRTTNVLSPEGEDMDDEGDKVRNFCNG